MSNYVWTEQQREAISKRKKMRALYKGEHETYFVLPNGEQRRYEYVTVNWLGDLLSQTWARLLFRQLPVIGTKEDSRKEELQQLVEAVGLEDLYVASAPMVSWAGAAIWKPYWSSLKQSPVLRLWCVDDSEQVFLEYLPQDRSIPVAVSYWYGVKVERDTYWVRERHELLVGQNGERAVRLTNTAFKSDGGEPVDEVIPLASVLPDAVEEEVIRGLDMLPCVIIQNPDRDGDGAGDSDYTKSLIEIQRNINKLVAQRQFVLDTSEAPLFSIPPEYMDENGDVDWSRVRIRIRQDGEPGGDIEISSWDGNLSNSEHQWTQLRQEFRALTGLAPALSGETDGGGDSGYARRLGMVPTEAEVGSRRRCWEKGIKEALNIAQAIARVYGNATGEPISDISISWPVAIPEDPAEVSQQVQGEYREGVLSLRTAVQRLHPDWSEEQIAAEVDAIQSDNRERAALAQPLFA